MKSHKAEQKLNTILCGSQMRWPNIDMPYLYHDMYSLLAGQISQLMIRQLHEDVEKEFRRQETEELIKRNKELSKWKTE